MDAPATVPPNLGSYDRTFGQIGMWAIPNLGYTFTTLTPAASTYRLARFVPTRNMTVAKIGFVTSVAATHNDNVDVGIYDASGARLVSSGATAGKANATAGPQTISISSTALTAGVAYYAALAYGTVGGTAATLLGIGGQTVGIPAMFGSSIGALEISGAGSGATLPSSVSAANNTSVGFALALLES